MAIAAADNNNTDKEKELIDDKSFVVFPICILSKNEQLLDFIHTNYPCKYYRGYVIESPTINLGNDSYSDPLFIYCSIKTRDIFKNMTDMSGYVFAAYFRKHFNIWCNHMYEDYTNFYGKLDHYTDMS